MSKIYMIDPSAFHARIAKALEQVHDEDLKALMRDYIALQGEIVDKCRARDIVGLKIMEHMGMTETDVFNKLINHKGD